MKEEVKVAKYYGKVMCSEDNPMVSLRDVVEIITCSDRIYTDEHDRQVANDYKESILKGLTS